MNPVALTLLVWAGISFLGAVGYVLIKSRHNLMLASIQAESPNHNAWRVWLEEVGYMLKWALIYGAIIFFTGLALGRGVFELVALYHLVTL